MSTFIQIPIGNTFDIIFHPIINGQVDDLAGMANLLVKIEGPCSHRVIAVTDVSVINDTIKLTVRGEKQRLAGIYRLIVTYTSPDLSISPPFRQRRFDVVAFELVQGLASNNNSDTCADIEIPLIELEGCIQFGKDGKSAYQSALDGGFIGTELEFNTSLASIGDIGALLDEINGEEI